MRAILDVILLILQLYQWVVIATAIMSWLIAFDVVNFRSDFVRSVWNTLNALTEPVLRPIRNVLPNLGGLDISPIILLLLIFFIERVITYYLYPLALAY
ncbi:MAG: YggT family protein [Beijerinckiaceae bacterium]